MGEILFFVKSLVVTVLFIVVMQIEVGTVTLEEKAEDWIRTSAVSSSLSKVAQGAALAAKESIQKVMQTVHRTIGSGSQASQNTGRLQQFNVQRSSVVQEVQNSQAAQKAAAQ